MAMKNMRKKSLYQNLRMALVNKARAINTPLRRVYSVVVVFQRKLTFFTPSSVICIEGILST